jgi:hypothetical protein
MLTGDSFWARRSWLLAAAVLAAGCDKHKGSDAPSDTSDAPAKTASAQPSTSAVSSEGPAASSSAAPGTSGPTVTIPAGTLNAGYACGAVPRVTDEELAHPAIALGEFSIDVYPYPNDPSQPAKTGVSRDDAKGLCEASGKRLCSELEWERACKGGQDSSFEYEGNYDANACKVLATLMPNLRPKCASDFGVKDMHGLVYEWTSSAWGRGTSELVATRGSFGKSDIVRERCASGHGKPAGEASKEIGFRCCSGPTNSAVVDLAIGRDPPLSEDPKIDAKLAGDLLHAMAPDHQTVTDASVSFDKLWRWHPRANEELLVARWIGRPKRGLPWFEIAVFNVCGGAPSRVATMRGPVRKLGDPTVGTNIEQVSIPAETKADKGTLKLDYWYGSVKIEQPAFIRTGNSIASDDKLVPVPTRPTRIPIPKKK